MRLKPSCRTGRPEGGLDVFRFAGVFLVAITLLAAFPALLLSWSPFDPLGETSQPPGADANAPPASPGDGPPPLPSQQAAEFYVDVQGQAQGPFSAGQISEMITSGQVQRSTLLWKRGTVNWRPAGEFKEFIGLFASTAPPVPRSRKFEQLITGIWEFQEEVWGVMTSTRIQYMSDGNYTGVQTVLPTAASPAASVPLAGRWRITTVSDERFIIVETPQGMPWQAYNRNYLVIDQNTLRNEDTNVIARRIDY